MVYRSEFSVRAQKFDRNAHNIWKLEQVVRIPQFKSVIFGVNTLSYLQKIKNSTENLCRCAWPALKILKQRSED